MTTPRPRTTVPAPSTDPAYELLKRLRQWDALNPLPDPIPAPFGDLPFWVAEIDRVLAGSPDA